MSKLKQGIKYNILFKPSKLKYYYFIRETKKCLIMSKISQPEKRKQLYFPKKNVLKVEKAK